MTMASAGAIRGEYWPDGGFQWRPRPAALTLDLPHWVMRSARYRLIRMAIEMARKQLHFFCC
jgi:hypothetical protein